MKAVIIALAPIVLFLWAFLVYTTGFKRGTVVLLVLLVVTVLFPLWIVFCVNQFG